MQGYPTPGARGAPPVQWFQQGVPGSWGTPGPGAMPDWNRAASSPSLGSLVPGTPATYPFAGLPAGMPPVRPMPGPAALGPGQAQGSMGTGGVAGVGINPVPVVQPPAATGGPHPLPVLPALPLPEGFPNPFALNQPTDASAPQQGPLAFAPGTVTTTGPQGYHPGLGQLGASPQAVQAALESAGAQAQVRAPQAAPAPPPAAQAVGQAPQAPQAPQASPFWLALAWQLVCTPAVRSALGERLKRVVDGDSRMRLIETATGLLLSPELQEAFRGLANGKVGQTPFISLFTDRLGSALDGAGLEPAW